jgi:hypothetical protein
MTDDLMEPRAQEAIQRSPGPDRDPVYDRLVATSTAISLKRLADMLEPKGVRYSIPVPVFPINIPSTPLAIAARADADIESLAGDMLNVTEGQVFNADDSSVVVIIRRLASAVLRKAENDPIHPQPVPAPEAVATRQSPPRRRNSPRT